MGKRRLPGLAVAAGIAFFAAGTVAEGAVELSYYTPSYGFDTYIGREALEKVIPEHDAAEVTPVCFAEEQYYATLKAKLATHDGPDLFFVQPEYAGFNGVYELSEAGVLQDISDLANVQRLLREAPESLIGQGEQIYSVSFGSQLSGVRYHKKIFEQYGLQVPENWEEFLQCCQILKENEVQPFLLFTHSALYQIAVNQIYRKNPDYAARLLSGEAKFTDEGTWDEALKRYFTMYELGYVQETPVTMSMVEMAEQFAEGSCAMMQVAITSYKIYEEDDENDEEYGYFVIPGNDKGEEPCYMLGQVGGMALYAETEHPQESREILDALIGEMKLGELDNLKDYYPGLERAVEEGRCYHPCNYDWKNEVETVVQKKLNEYLMSGRLSIEDVTAAMQAEFDRRS